MWERQAQKFLQLFNLYLYVLLVLLGFDKNYLWFVLSNLFVSNSCLFNLKISQPFERYFPKFKRSTGFVTDGKIASFNFLFLIHCLEFLCLKCSNNHQLWTLHERSFLILLIFLSKFF